METITIEDRKQISILGANKIISSTTSQAIVEISDTSLVISGSNIEVRKLDLENKEVCFSGEIISLKYIKKGEKTGFLKRLFK